MKPAPFQLHRPDTIADALEVLGSHEDSKVLAGGQSLIPLMSFRLARPEHLIDIGGLAGLRQINRTPAATAIGAMVSQRKLELSPIVARNCPLLAAALPHIAHPPIRNMGTLGGSLSHGDPAAELPAVAVALNAEMIVTGPSGTRAVPAEEFFVAPLVTSLAPDELLIETKFPHARPRTAVSFMEVSPRPGDFAVVGVATQITLAADSTACDVRIAFFGVADRPLRCREAEAMVRGRPPGRKVSARAAATAREILMPPSDLHGSADYRRDIAGTLLERALIEAGERAAQARSAESADPKNGVDV